MDKRTLKALSGTMLAAAMLSSCAGTGTSQPNNAGADPAPAADGNTASSNAKPAGDTGFKRISDINATALKGTSITLYTHGGNRVLGEELYTYSDRYDAGCSYGMFKAVMEHHNPTLNIDKAVDVWNEKATEIYRENVKNYYAIILKTW